MKKVDLIPADEYQIEQCKLFTSYVFDTNSSTYKSRGSSSNEKIMKDIYNGKIAECMVWNYLEGEGHKPKPVDFTIYEKKRKSFDCDILLEDKNIHVKSCMGDSKYPNSWLFQKFDPVVNNPDESDYFFLCVLTDPNEGFSYILKSSEATYEEPIAFPLRRTKVAVYERDLI